jgi:DNA modification methylase
VHSISATNGERVGHPTQKPVRLMQWCMDQARIPEGATVLDPFMGSGTTAVACHRTGRKFIGIEKDARYFEIARKRLENELRQGLLPLTHNKALCETED